MISLEVATENFHEFCEGICRDVSAHIPIPNDAGYDSYVDDHVYADAPTQIFGVMDMGDVGQWVFQAVVDDRYSDGRSVSDWVDVTGSFDPVEVKDRIIAKRTAGS